MRFWTLEMKCTQYWICGEGAFKNARAMVFLKVERGGQKFSGRYRKTRSLRGAAAPDLLSLPRKACKK